MEKRAVVLTEEEKIAHERITKDVVVIRRKKEKEQKTEQEK